MSGALLSVFSSSLGSGLQPGGRQEHTGRSWLQLPKARGQGRPTKVWGELGPLASHPFQVIIVVGRTLNRRPNQPPHKNLSAQRRTVNYWPCVTELVARAHSSCENETPYPLNSHAPRPLPTSPSPGPWQPSLSSVSEPSFPNCVTGLDREKLFIAWAPPPSAC